MNKRRMKEEYVIADVAKELQNILKEEDILSKQKCYIYSQYKMYKELYLNLKNTNNKLLEENRRLYKIHVEKEENETSNDKENISNIEKEITETLNDKENINNRKSGMKTEETSKDCAYIFDISDFVNTEFQDNKFSYKPSALGSEISKNIVDQLDDMRKELEIKEKKIIELENSVLKYQIMRRSSTTRASENEVKDVDVYKEEIINLKTKIEYLRLAKERESIAFNSKINEYKIKHEETTHLYRNAIENLNSSLLNLESIRSYNKNTAYEKLSKIESLDCLLINIGDIIEELTLGLATLNSNYRELYKMYEIERKNYTTINEKLENFKVLSNKQNEAKGDEFYEQEIANLLNTCNTLVEENKKLSKEIMSYRTQDLSALRNQNENLTVQVENSRKRDITRYIDTINNLNKKIEEYICKLKESDNDKNRLTKLNIERIKHNEKYKEDIKIKDIEIHCLENKYKRTVEMIEEYKKEIEERYRESLVCNREVDKVNLKCNLCDFNNKNIAITSCMHTFCEDCINTRIKMRDRKCPTCGMVYNVYEVKKIYF